MLVLFAVSAALAVSALQEGGIDREAARADMSEETARPAALPASGLDDGAIARVSLPILLPAQGEGIEGDPAFYARDLMYTARFRHEGARVSLTGTARRQQSLSTGRSPGPAFSLTATGSQLGFTRYGAGYVLDIECGADAPPACPDEDFARSIQDTLVVAAVAAE